MRGRLFYAILGASILVPSVSAISKEALMFFDYYWNSSSLTVPGNDDSSQITIPCEAISYVSKKEYNLDNGVPSPLGNYTGITIKYETNYGNLTELDQLHFKLINGKFGNLTKCWLVFYENNGVDTNGDGIGDKSHDANGDGDFYDSLVIAESIGNIKDNDEIFFRVTNNGVSYPSNGILYLECAEPDEPPVVDKDLGSSPGAQHENRYNPVIVIGKLYKEKEHYNICPEKIPKPQAKVCLTVSGNSGAMNTDLKLPDLSITTPQCFIDTKCEFTLNMRPTLSIINMYPKSLGSADCTNSKSGIFKCYDTSYEPGTQFVDEPSGTILESASCTDNEAADGTITIIDNDDNVEDPIKLGSNGWKAKFHVSLYDVNGKYACDNTSYVALDFAHNRMFIDNNGDDTSPGSTSARIPLIPGNACTIGDEVYVKDISTCSPDPNTICIPSSGVWTDDVYMGVTGNDRLYWVKWGLTEQLDIISPDNDVVFRVKMDEKAKCTNWDCCYDNEGNQPYFKKWEPNGQEAYIPHLLNNGLTYVKVANNSCWDAEVYARVWDEDGDFVDNVYLGVVPAHGGAIFWGKDIFAKAKALNPAIGGGYGTFSAIITVGAPKRDVEIAAGDSRDGKGKMLPVYDLDGQELYYRNVNFDQDTFDN